MGKPTPSHVFVTSIMEMTGVSRERFYQVTAMRH